jgi:hypothetical protein
MKVRRFQDLNLPFFTSELVNAETLSLSRSKTGQDKTSAKVNTSFAF